MVLEKTLLNSEQNDSDARFCWEVNTCQVTPDNSAAEKHFPRLPGEWSLIAVGDSFPLLYAIPQILISNHTDDRVISKRVASRLMEKATNQGGETSETALKIRT